MVWADTIRVLHDKWVLENPDEYTLEDAPDLFCFWLESWYDYIAPTIPDVDIAILDFGRKKDK